MPPKKPTYQKLDQIDHIHKRPDMYLGSLKVRTYNDEWIFDRKVSRIKIKDSIRYSEGLLRIFVEALSNAIDNVWRSRQAKVSCTKIKVSIDQETGETSIWNDGLTIPIEKNEDTGLYNPELIFGHLLTSSNYDDTEERFTSGRNGLGIKLTNVFSEEFSVRTFEESSGKLYEKDWSNNMRDSDEHVITTPKNIKKGFTEVTWIPDFEKFGMKGYDNNTMNLFYKYIYDAAMVSKIPIYVNDSKVPVKSLIDYARFFTSISDESITTSFGNCEVVITPSSSNSFQHVAFTNGVYNREGGTHVDAWSEELFRPLMAKLNKPNKPHVNNPPR